MNILSLQALKPRTPEYTTLGNSSSSSVSDCCKGAN
jgi:hypothetical protein